MNKDDWKTPLGYYERAIEELKSTREELQTELEAVRELKASHETLKAELEATKAELQDTKQRLEKLASKAQATADSAASKIESVKAGIENGSIVAQKALMLKARDDKHWMRFKYLKDDKYDTFLVWKENDIWYHTVRVGGADKLRD